MAEVRVGMRLKSTVSQLTVIVIRPGKGLSVDDVQSAGAPMVLRDAEVGAQPEPDSADTVRLPVGKRYASEADGFELLVTQAGLGPLTIRGKAMELKQPRQLPSSD
jgi:hypothetical protein